MKVLITGSAGYAGSQITNFLLQQNFEIIGVDALWFDKTVPGKILHPNYKFIKMDIRNTEELEKILQQYQPQYIIHAAAIVGDPASKLFPDLTIEVNYEATKNLINLARIYSVKGFIFFSTCSNYGISKDSIANEQSPLNPLSLYAKTKVDIENFLMEKVKDLDWIICRLSTLYGLSFRMRFDLTVNEFVLKAFAENYIDIYKPLSYRPYLHTYDLANIIHKILLNFDVLKNQVFNIGFIGENYQKIRIAQLVQNYLPQTRIDILNEGGDDRDYQVDFSKIHNFLQIQQNFNVQKGIEEIVEKLKQNNFKDFHQGPYYNTKPNFYE